MRATTATTTTTTTTRERSAATDADTPWWRLLKWDYPPAIALPLVGSLLFLGLPGFCHFLYVTERLNNPTGVSSNEWIWIGFTSLWIGAIFQLPSPSPSSSALSKRYSVVSRDSFRYRYNQFRGYCYSHRCLSKENTVFWIFLVANALWMAIPVILTLRRRISAAVASAAAAAASETTNTTTDTTTDTTTTIATTMNHPFVTWNEIIGLTGGKAAWPALWNVAFVCIPIQRVSPLLQSIGVSSQQAVKVHIWAANAALLWLLVHTVLLSLVYVWDTDYNATEWLELMLPYKMYYTEGVVNFMGWVGLLSFLGLWGFSLPVVRNRFYEPFKVLHWILAACFLIGSNLHDYATFFFIQPSVVLMVADFLLRRHTRIESLASASVSVSASSTTPTIPIPTSTISSTTSTTSSLSQRQIDAESRTSTATTNTTTTTTHSAEGLAMVSSSKNGSLASLTFPIPDSWPRQMIANEPGLHVYLTIPNISRWQSHPFSISEVDTKNKTFSIHVKALGGWSETLVSTIHNNSNNNNNNNNGGVHGNTDETETAASLLSLEVEGPYSSPALYKTIRLPQKHCIFLAGGVGITGVVALAKARCRELREHFGRGGNDNDNDTDNDQSLGTPSSFTTTLLWLVQTQAEAEFLLPLLKDDNDKDGSCDGGRHSLCTHVWITRPERHETTSDNEDDDDDDDDEVEIGRRHNTILPTSTTITFRARWDFGARWNTTIVLCASLLSSVLLTMLSRWICVVQPAAEIEHEENLPYRVRECSFLGHSTNCRSCDIEDTFDLDEAYPCCTTPVCEYCFRGVPMLLSFLGMPPLTALLVRAFHAVWLRSFGAGRNLFGGYATVDNHEAFELPVTTDTLGTTNCNGNNDERAVLSGERIDTDRNGSELGRESSDEMRRRGGTIRFHVGERPKNISALLSNNYLPPGLVFHGIANPRDVLVLLCGPPNLIESTKRELVNDPLRKHWRVAMAS